MPALSKLIGRRQIDNNQSTTTTPVNLQHHQHQNLHTTIHVPHEDSSSITNSIIFTPNNANSTTSDEENEEEAEEPARSGHCCHKNKLIGLPLSLMSVSSSSAASSSSSSLLLASPVLLKETPSSAQLQQQQNNNCQHHQELLLLNNNNVNNSNNSNCYQNLTHLDISGNSAEKLDLRSLTRLEWLCCSNNNLEILVLSGISLTYLDCSHNNLQCISIDPLPNNLTTLQISFNNLEELPVWTWIVPELHAIYASNNHLRQIDCKYQNCLLQLPIRELYVYANKIEFISKDFITRATRLKILNLSQNLIEYMPNFGKRCQIQELYMSRNQLQDNEQRPALEFLYDCTYLRRLYLAFNKIQHIHERCLASWKNLEELILCGNRIRSLPAKFSTTLPALRVLRVHSNQLEAVPNLTKLSTLKVVDLSHNNLRKINLENLIVEGNLTYLDISCNENLNLNLDNIHSPKRPMNLVEVTHPRKSASHEFLTHNQSNNKNYDFSLTNQLANNSSSSPWDLGFAELPDKNQVLSVAQYRDVNLSNGRETLFGLFDSGNGNPAPKSLSKSIAKIYVEEKTIDESPKFSLKYTLLNALNCMFDADRNSRKQTGIMKPVHGVLCLLTMNENSANHNGNGSNSSPEDPLFDSKTNCMLNLAMIGNVRCILVEAGKKIKVLADLNSNNPENSPKSEPSTPNETKTKLSPESPNSTESNENVPTSTTTTNTAYTTNKTIQDPTTISVPLTRTTEFLIIANSNVWSYVNDQELVDELDLHRHKKSVLISKRIADLGQSHSCKESLSLILVRFKWNNTTSQLNQTKLLMKKHVSKVGIIDDSENQHVHGPMSYVTHHQNLGSGGSSDGYSDELTNPLASVTTPDSAIDTDNRSSRSSGSDSNKSTEKRRNHLKSFSQEIMDDSTNNSNKDPDIVSLSNSTSPSQMSVEQFRCWEYMLEQNTRLLFKKELDSLSKATFARNQKQRKSVHFPFKQQNNQQQPLAEKVQHASQLILQGQGEIAGLNSSKSKESSGISPGFFTLSKAKSLSHLFGGGGHPENRNMITGSVIPIRKRSVPSHGNLSVAFRPMPHQQHLLPHMFSSSSGGPGNVSTNGIMLDGNNGGSQAQFRQPLRGTIIGGPNAAYFGSVQRQIPITLFQPSTSQQAHPSAQQILYEKDEIQELKNLDSLEHDNNRLKKYWDTNKITEL